MRILLPGRAYPWGDEFQTELANTAETGIDATSSVGCFPGGASPYGVQDLAGNVWEWQEDWYDKGKEYKSLRGGSWSLDLGGSPAVLTATTPTPISGARCGFSGCPLANFLIFWFLNFCFSVLWRGSGGFTPRPLPRRGTNFGVF